MATVIGDAAVRILPDMRQFATRMRAQMRTTTSGIARDMRATGITMGRTLGDGFIRGADGRLRDARGRFVTAGQLGGDGYARGFTRTATSGLQSAVTNITNVTTTITNSVVNEGQRAGAGFTQGISRSTSGAADAFKPVGAAAVGMGALIAKSVLTAGAEFEAAMNGVRAVTGATGKSFLSLEALAMQLGSSTQFGATEAANAMEFLGMAGWDTSQVLKGLPSVLNLAAAGKIELADAANIASNIMSAFGADAAEAGRFSDALAYAATNANVTIGGLGMALSKSAGAANSAGWSIEQAAAATGLFGDVGIQAEESGTGLAHMVGELMKQTGPAADVFKKFGVEVQNSDGSVRDLADILIDARKAGMGFNDATEAFGADHGKKFATMLGLTNDHLKASKFAADDAAKSAKEMAEVRAEGLLGSLKGVMSALEGLQIRLSKMGALAVATLAAQVFADALRSLTGWLKQNTEMLKPYIQVIGALVAGFAGVVGGVLLVKGAMLAGGAALAALLSPVGLVAAGAAALGVGFMLAWRHSEAFRDGVRSLADVVRTGVVAAFQSLRVTFTTTLLPALQRLGQVVMQELLPALGALVQAVAGRVMPIARQIGAIFTGIIIPAVMRVYAALTGALIPVLQALADFVRQRVVPAVQLIGDRLSELITKAQPVIQVIASIVTWLAQMAGRIIGTVVPILIRLAGPIFTALFSAIGVAIGFLGTLIGWLVTVGRAFATLGRWVSWLWQKAIQPAFRFIMQAARLVATVLLVAVIAPIVLAVRALGAIFGWLWRNAIRPAVQGIGTLAKWLWQNAIRPAFQAVQAQIRALATVFRWLYSNIIQPVFRVIATVIRAWWVGARTIFSAVMSFIRGPLGSVFRWLRDNIIRPVFTVIRSTISTVWQRGIRPVFAALRTAVGKVADAFRAARDGIKKAWDRLKTIAKGPVNFVIRTVYNDGIRKVWNAVTGAFGGKKLDKVSGLAHGGILPGSSSYRGGDDQLVPMRRGEGVYVSEAMRDPYERARLYAINRAAMAGRSLAPFQHMEGDGRRYGGAGGFALGGIFDGIGDVASSAWDKAKQSASWLKDTFGGAIKAGVKTVVNPLINLIPGSGGFTGLLKSMARKAVDRLLGAGDEGDKVVGKFVKPVAAAIGTRYGVPGKMWASGFHTGTDFPAATGTAVRAAMTGRVTSTSSAGPYGNHIRMSHVGGLSTLYAHLSRMAVTAGRNVAGGRRIGAVGSTGNSTGPHLHFEARRGGRLINPESLFGKFDRGGWLMPGHMAFNGLSTPEAVLTPPQWQTLSALAGRAAEGIETSRSLGQIVGGGASRSTSVTINNNVTLENHGVLGSQMDVENWLARTMDRLNRTGRLPATLGGR